MKIRLGFVSNSSSSSFIVKDKSKFEEAKKFLNDIRQDYYIFKDVLYTPFISDGLDEYVDICHNQIFDSLHEGSHGYPYDETEYVEVEGEIGRDSIWIPRENLTDEDLIELGQAPYYISSKMYFEVEKFLKLENPTIEDRDYLILTLRNIYEGEE